MVTDALGPWATTLSPAPSPGLSHRACSVNFGINVGPKGETNTQAPSSLHEHLLCDTLYCALWGMRHSICALGRQIRRLLQRPCLILPSELVTPDSLDTEHHARTFDQAEHLHRGESPPDFPATPNMAACTGPLLGSAQAHFHLPLPIWHKQQPPRRGQERKWV